jgi:O-antigen/teichoic acid export membrane protein
MNQGLGTRWLVFAQCAAAAGQVVQLALLARLLEPADFGAMAFGLSLLFLCQHWADFGMSGVVIYRRDLSARQLGAMLTLNVALAAALGLALIFAAPLAELWIGDPRPAAVLPWLALSLLFSAPGWQYRALLQRELRFAQIALAEMAAPAISIIVAYSMARLGYGVYSLVGGVLSGSAITTLVLLGAGWRLQPPRLRFALGENAGVLRFGAYQTGSGTINFAYSQLDILLVGSLLGATALGQYSLAKQLCTRPLELINPILTRAALPVLSRIREDKDALRRFFLDTLAVVNALGFPVYCGLIVCAQPLVIVLLGERWLPMTPVLQWLAAATVIRAFGNPVGALLLATGAVERAFRWELVMLVTLPPVIFTASQFGASGTAAGVFLMYAGILYPMWRLLVLPTCGASLPQWIGTATIPLGLAAISAGAALAVSPLADWPAAKLALQLAVGALAYAALTWGFNRPTVKFGRTLW